jgi:alpha-galactosidase
LIHTGTAVHEDVRDEALRTVGYVARDDSAAVYTIATVASIEHALPERVRLHGLDPDRRYRVTVRDETGGFETSRDERPEWTLAPTVVSGRVLSTVGLQTPALWPLQAVVVHAVAV